MMICQWGEGEQVWRVLLCEDIRGRSFSYMCLGDKTVSNMRLCVQIIKGLSEGFTEQSSIPAACLTKPA